MGRIISNGIDFSGTNLITPECYSTEERVVGCWTDGKPLYQKTISFGALPNSSTKTVSCNLTNLDNVVGIEGIAYNQNGTRNLPFIDDASKNYDVLLDYIKSNDVVRIICHSDLSSLTGFVTIKYTKSTDVAGSGTWTPSGIPAVHYSEQEHVIGTWMGETLYQKTIHTGALSTGEGTKPHNISNFGTLINATGLAYYSGYVLTFPFVSIGQNSWNAGIGGADTTNIVTEVGSSFTGNSAITDSYITLQYTKST